LQVLHSLIYSASKTSGFNETNLFATANNRQSQWWVSCFTGKERQQHFKW